MIETTDTRQQEAAELFHYIKEILAEKRVLRVNNKLSIRNFSSTGILEKVVNAAIAEYLDMLEFLELNVIEDDLNHIKNTNLKQLAKINIVIKEEYNNKSFSSDDISRYNAFRHTQLALKVKFMQALTNKKHAKDRGKKFLWKGSQLQLIELFHELFDKQWLHAEPLSKELISLPIIESFDIWRDSKFVAINEDSFNKEWKGESVEGKHFHFKANYTPLFTSIPKNPRSSKK